MGPLFRLSIFLLAARLRGARCTFSLFFPQDTTQYLSETQFSQPLQQPQYSQPLQQFEYSQPQYGHSVQRVQISAVPLQQVQYNQAQQQYNQPQQQYNSLQSEYNQLPEQQSNGGALYWEEDSQSPATSPSPADYEEGGMQGYKYKQSYQSTYRQQVSGIPYTIPTQLYQQHPGHHHHHLSNLPSYQARDPVRGVLGERVAGPNTLPMYQLVTIGPEVPVLIRLPNQETAVLPVRTVYTLPGFLERIVQRVQNFYSVYNPLEVLKVPRNNGTDSEENEVPAPPSPTPAEPIQSTTVSSSGTSEDAHKVSSSTEGSTSAPEVVTEQEETTGAESTTQPSTESNNISVETTTQ